MMAPEQKQKVFIITDTHFYHHNMLKLCGRPPGFSELIMENWRRDVRPGDLVIHLGDISWTNDTYMESLPGTKILVRGNHDNRSNAYYLEHGFSFVCNSFTLRANGMDILFTHMPKLFHDYDINICGHTHNQVKINSPTALKILALEKDGYGPILLDKVLASCKDIVNSKPKFNQSTWTLFPEYYSCDLQALKLLAKTNPNPKVRETLRAWIETIEVTEDGDTHGEENKASQEDPGLCKS